MVAGDPAPKHARLRLARFGAASQLRPSAGNPARLAVGGGDHPFDRSSGLRFRRLLGNTRAHRGVVGVYQYNHISVPRHRRPQPKGVQKSVRKSRSNLEPVSQRATVGTLLTVRPASDFAVCSVTPVRTFGWSVCINTVKFQYPNIASGSQTGLRRGGAAGPQIPRRATWGCLGAF